jgi:hypothetical protein
MLLLSIVSATMLLMMTRHRIWLISAAGGAFLATCLWTLMVIFERVLPSTMQAFSGVLSFLLVAVVALGALTVHEKLQHEGDDF